MKMGGVRQHKRESALGYGIVAAVLGIFAVLSIAFHGQLASLLAAATSSLSGAPVVLFFTPADIVHLAPGDTTDVNLVIEANVPVNAAGITLQYPPDKMEIVGISKKTSFLDLWTEDTVIKEETGELHFSGGTTKRGGLLGTSTVLTLSMRAKEPGEAALVVEDAQVFAANGNGSLIESASRPLHFSITAQSASLNSGGSMPSKSSSTLSADLNGDGSVSLVDVSILIIHLLMPYDARYDLNGDGRINLGDLSILFSHMGDH